VRAALRAPRPPLWILVAVSMLQPFALNILAPATPGLARALQTDYGTIQLTLTLYLLGVAVTQLVVGPISDRIGRRPCVLAALGLFVAGSALGAVATSIETLLLARVIQAAGGGTCFALSRAIVRDFASANEAASLIGYITMAMVVSPMIAPSIGGVLDLRFGWRSIFVAMLVFGAAVSIAAWWLLSETAARARGQSLGDVLRGFPALARDRLFQAYAVSLAFTSASFFVFIAGAPFIVVEVMGYGPETYGLFFIVNAGGYMLGNFCSGRFGRRLGGDRLIRLGTAVSVLSIVLELAAVAVLPWSPATLFLPLALNAVGNGLSIPGGTAAALSVRPELAGTAAGLVGALQLGLGALGAVLAGHFVPLWPPALIALMGVSAVIGWLALRIGPRQP
jgi:MFS transporter, DHA1 family, multidrug resistance protein